MSYIMLCLSFELRTFVLLVLAAIGRSNASTSEAEATVVAAAAEVDDDSAICVSHEVDNCDGPAESTAKVGNSTGRNIPMFRRRHNNIMVNPRQPYNDND